MKTKTDAGIDTYPLIEALYRAEANEDRATLAKLRRGLGKDVGQPGAADRDGWVLMRLPEGVRRAKLDRCCLVASLFGLHPHPQPNGSESLGSAFRQLWKDSKEAEGPERRFVALLDSDPADLPMRLRQAVSLLKANGIPIDWGQLLRDLGGWSHPDRYVQRRWVEDFWGARNRQDEDAEE